VTAIRFSNLMLLGLSALLTVSIAIAMVAYTSSDKTIAVLKRLSVTFEPARNRLDKLNALMLDTNLRFQKFTSSDYVHGAELRYAAMILEKKFHVITESKTVVDPARQAVLLDVVALFDDLDLAIRTKANSRTQPSAWAAAHSQLESRLIGLRTDLRRLESQDGSEIFATPINSIVGHIENLFMEFSRQDTISIADILSPLEQANDIIDSIVEEIQEIHSLEFAGEMKHLQAALSRFKSAAVLFDDEAKLQVSGSNLDEIFETADNARKAALVSLNSLKSVIETRIVQIQKGEIAKGDRRQILFLIFAMVSVIIAGTTAMVLRTIMTDRIGKLVDGTKEISRGNLAFRLKSDASDEFEQVSEAVNTMVGELADTISALKVAQTDASVAREKAEQANQMKSKFMANMSHELRTPLNAIIGFSEVIKMEMFGTLGSPQYSEYASDIERSGKHLLNLINAVLDLSKIESGKAEFIDTEIDMSKLMNEAIKSVEARANEKSINFSKMMPSQLPLLRADRTAINQILLNILTNAVKFTDTGGSIETRIVLNEDGGHLISVADTGVGIPPEDFELIMMPFGQSRNIMTGEEEGTGLGLSISRSIVERHGGFIDLESELGVGTKISVHFPAARAVFPKEKTG